MKDSEADAVMAKRHDDFHRLHKKRLTTFDEIVDLLVGAGRPVTVYNALMVMLVEMNWCLGTAITVSETEADSVPAAEGRAEIERTLAFINRLCQQFVKSSEQVRGVH